jgi:polar amino acid transport system substrate-binding protein
MDSTGIQVRLYRTLLICVTLLLIFVVAHNLSWARPLPQPPSDLDRIKARDKLIVAMYFEDVPPFFMHTGRGEFIGIDVEIAQDIGRKLGVEVEFNRAPTTFDAIVNTVVNGEADVAISLLSDTLNRATQVRFTNSYAVLRQTLLINRLKLAQAFPSAELQTEIRTLLNQANIKIGVIAGTSYVDFVRADYPLATHVFYDDFATMEQDLREGKIFALLYDELEIMNWRYANPDGGLHLKTVVLTDRKDTIAMAVRRDDVDLLAWLNLYLQKIHDDGSLEALLHTYLGQNDWRSQ